MYFGGGGYFVHMGAGFLSSEMVHLKRFFFSPHNHGEKKFPFKKIITYCISTFNSESRS